MEYRRFLSPFMRRTCVWGVVLGVGMLLMPTSSIGAKPSIFLHFGSFEAATEADVRLKEIQKKHTGLLTGLDGAVREVEVRPGLKVYRAQAGPVADRFQAQSICGQFASNGDECYIIETVVAQAPAQIEPAGKTLAQATEQAAEQTQQAATQTVAAAANTASDSIAPAKDAISEAVEATEEAGETAEETVENVSESVAQAKQLVTPPAQESKPKPSINTLYDQVESEQVALNDTKDEAVQELIARNQPRVTATVPSAQEVVNTPSDGALDNVASEQARGAITNAAEAVKNENTLDSVHQSRDPETQKVLQEFAGKNAAVADTSALPVRVTKEVGQGADIAAREASIEDALQQARDNQPVVVPKTPEQIEQATEESAWYDSINPFSSDEDALPIQNESELASAEEDRSFIDTINPFSSDEEPVQPQPAAPETARVASASSTLPEPPQTIAVKRSTASRPDVPVTNRSVTPRGGDAAKAALNQPPPVLENSYLAVQKPTAPVTNNSGVVAKNNGAPVVAPSAPRGASSQAVLPDNLPPPPLPEDDTERRALANNVMREPIATGMPVTQLQQGQTAPTSSVTSGAPRATPRIAPPPPAQAQSLQPIQALDSSGAVRTSQPQPQPKTLTAEELPPIPGGISIADAAEITNWAEYEARQKALTSGNNVAVEEATRVPLSEDDGLREPLPPPPVVAQGSPVTVAEDNLPSQTSQRRTLWAHLSAFDSKQEALRFWRAFRNDNPDFPSVRVRVTSAFVSQRVGRDTVSLRVGPFGNAGFIEGLCEDKKVYKASLTCQPVRDLGSANYARNARVSQPAGISNGRYGSDTHGFAPASGVWVQLGTFTTADRANDQWDALKIAHKSTLRAMKASISSPVTGSHSTPLYRLRTGPFVNQAAAQELCARLKISGTSCLVVAER